MLILVMEFDADTGYVSQIDILKLELESVQSVDILDTLVERIRITIWSFYYLPRSKPTSSGFVLDTGRPQALEFEPKSLWMRVKHPRDIPAPLVTLMSTLSF